jgi:competence protein ComGC
MKHKGFTLLEVIIYIFLFLIMMGSLVIVCFQMIQNSENINYKDSSREEINFVLKKIDWALIDAYRINHPSNNESDYLEVMKENFFNNPISFKLNTNDPNYHHIELCLKTDCQPLTSNNINIEKLTFTPLKNYSSTGVKIIIKINGLEITSIKYLKYER